MNEEILISVGELVINIMNKKKSANVASTLIEKEAIGKIVINTLIEKKVVSYTYLRNVAVKKMYYELRAQGLKSKEAREIIEQTPFFTTDGRKYYLTDKNIQKIVYVDEPFRYRAKGE